MNRSAEAPSQEPVEIVDSGAMHFTTIQTRVFKCPNCPDKIPIFRLFKFCPECGSPIIWK